MGALFAFTHLKAAAPLPAGQLAVDMQCKGVRTAFVVQPKSAIDVVGDVGTVGRCKRRLFNGPHCNDNHMGSACGTMVENLRNLKFLEYGDMMIGFSLDCTIPGKIYCY